MFLYAATFCDLWDRFTVENVKDIFFPIFHFKEFYLNLLMWPPFLLFAGPSAGGGE